MARVFLSPPHMGPAERELLLDAFDSNWIAPLGEHVDAFERELCDLVGAPHGAALSSGTAALHLALKLLGVGPGDEVMVSTLTFAASANVVAYLGATPVFVDSERSTWNIDPDLLAEALLERAMIGRLPKALMVVDLYGQCADYDRILPVCEAFGVPVVEDAAEALGATYRGVAAGRFGACGVFSFNGNKIITTSGGGMLVSDDEAMVQHARSLAQQARDPAPHYQHSEIGYNYRLSNLLAAVGRGQLQVLADRVETRRAVNRRYREALSDVPGIDFMPIADYGEPNCWLTCATIDPEEFGATTDDVRLHLESLDIEARPVWKPMHLQPAWAGCDAIGGEVSEEIFRNGLCLPSGTAMADADFDRVVEGVRAAVGSGDLSRSQLLGKPLDLQTAERGSFIETPPSPGFANVVEQH